MSSLRRLCAVLGVIGIVVITLAGNQPDQATGAVGLLRLRLGSVSGAEDYIFTAGNVVYPDGITVDAGTFYKIVVADGTGATRNGSFACTPAANVGTTNNTYTIKSTDPVSTSAAWTFNVQQYTTSACSGTPTKASKSFYVAAATSYADTGLTTAKSLFKAGDSAYVTVSGLKPGLKNWSVTWVQPNGTTTCANTAGSDRPDSGSSGKLPPAPNYVKYAPDATSTNAWNKLANYDAGSSCPAFASTNDGAWQMKLQFDATDFVTVPVFTVDATPPPVPTIASGPANPTAATTASFSFSDTESGATFLCSLDGAAFAA